MLFTLLWPEQPFTSFLAGYDGLFSYCDCTFVLLNTETILFDANILIFSNTNNWKEFLLSLIAAIQSIHLLYTRIHEVACKFNMLCALLCCALPVDSTVLTDKIMSAFLLAP